MTKIFKIGDRVRRRRQPANPWGTSQREGVIEDLTLRSSDPFGYMRAPRADHLNNSCAPAPDGTKYMALVCWFLPVRPNRLKGEMRRWIDLDRLESIGNPDPDTGGSS